MASQKTPRWKTRTKIPRTPLSKRRTTRPLKTRKIVLKPCLTISLRQLQQMITQPQPARRKMASKKRRKRKNSQRITKESKY